MKQMEHKEWYKIFSKAKDLVGVMSVNEEPKNYKAIASNLSDEHLEYVVSLVSYWAKEWYDACEKELEDRIVNNILLEGK